MSPRALLWIPLCLALLPACGTVRMKPADFPVADAQIPALARDLQIAVRPRFSRTPLRELRITGTNPIVSDDEFTASLVERLSRTLRERGVTLDPDAPRSIEIQVVKVALQQDLSLFCVIDFNRWLGDGRVRGLQSRARSVSFRTACAAAVSQAAVETLRDPETLAYVNGE